MRALAYSILLLYAVLSLLPFVWAFLVSVAPVSYEGKSVDIMQWPPRINPFKIPPEVFGAPATMENYALVFREVPYARWFLNTLLYASLTTLGHLVLDSFAGYAFARLKFPGKNALFAFLLSLMMVPPYVTIIPVYNLMVKYNLVNTYWGLFLPKLTGVFGLFLMRQFFYSIPLEIEESAMIDGAGVLTRFFKIALPMSKPALIALAIYTFLGSWNDFLWPLIITNDKSMFTLTMGLNFFRTTYYTFWQLMMAATIMMTIPMIVIFLVFQRYFVETGISAGLKG